MLFFEPLKLRTTKVFLVLKLCATKMFPRQEQKLESRIDVRFFYNYFLLSRKHYINELMKTSEFYNERTLKPWPWQPSHFRL
jgi:hypothetical protein